MGGGGQGATLDAVAALVGGTHPPPCSTSGLATGPRLFVDRRPAGPACH